MSKKTFFSYLKQIGVRIIDPQNTTIDETCLIGKNTIIYPNNIIKGKTVIGENCVIESNNYIENCNIGDGNKIAFSYMVDSKIFNFNSIGPFSRLRTAEIHNNCKIGNYVEIKKSIISNNVKASHLTYIGDAEVGENTNIGCGVIFCNYNGKDKFKTIVGSNCFVGSNCNLIAPLIIGDNTFIAAGCTIYKNVDSDKFVISNRDLSIKDDYKKIHIKRKD